MSLAIDLTKNQVELTKAERAASAALRAARDRIPHEVYCALQVQLCIIASESTRLKTNLGSLRIMGELEQRPPEVTAESLELARVVPMLPHDVDGKDAGRFAQELLHIGDDTLAADDENGPNVWVENNEQREGD